MLASTQNSISEKIRFYYPAKIAPAVALAYILAAFGTRVKAG